jgi:hypothetical protein
MMPSIHTLNIVMSVHSSLDAEDTARTKINSEFHAVTAVLSRSRGETDKTNKATYH